MKASKTFLESIADIDGVKTSGDLRRIVGNSLLALARKEISAGDVESMAKGLESISNSLNSEVKVAKNAIEMRKTGADIGKVVHLGRLLIDSSIGEPEAPQE